jgi:hypothetical protein
MHKIVLDHTTNDGERSGGKMGHKDVEQNLNDLGDLHKTIGEFKHYYHSLDMLLLDDI